MNVSDAPVQFNHKFTFIWHTTWIKPCEKCLRLNGKSWQGQTLYQHVLWDDFEGPIWDLDNDLPLTHPNCKCILEVQYDATLEELLKIEPSGFEDFQIMTSNIKEMEKDIEDFERSLERANGRLENTRAQLITYMMLLRRMHLPPDVERFISVMIRARMTAEMATRSAYLMMAASGPMGWLMAIASAGVAVIGVSDIAMDLGGT